MQSKRVWVIGAFALLASIGLVGTCGTYLLESATPTKDGATAAPQSAPTEADTKEKAGDRALGSQPHGAGSPAPV